MPGSSWVTEEENQATQTDFQGDVSTEKWDTYWQDWHKFQDATQDAQGLAEEIRLAIHQAVKQVKDKAMLQITRSINNSATAAGSNIGWLI